MKSRGETIFLIAALAVFAALWGATQPLSKIAVSEGYRAPGLVFWQLALATVFLGTVCHATGRGLPMHRTAVVMYVVIALIGTILPNSASYEAIRHLPSGLTSILLSLIPMMTFPIALLMATDRFNGRRFAGLFVGLGGVLLIVLPEASLPDRAMIAFVPLALIAPMFYALEGNVVAKWGTAGLDPIQLLYGASVFGAAIALPITLATGTFIVPAAPFGLPELAILLIGILHALAYVGYVWMVGRAGPIFAVQISYLVTGFGVFWAMLILGERYSGWVWAAMALMFLGMFLVQPRPKVALAQDGAAGDTAG